LSEPLLDFSHTILDIDRFQDIEIYVLNLESQNKKLFAGVNSNSLKFSVSNRKPYTQPPYLYRKINRAVCRPAITHSGLVTVFCKVMFKYNYEIVKVL
jgi:hypothetical protein